MKMSYKERYNIRKEKEKKLLAVKVVMIFVMMIAELYLAIIISPGYPVISGMILGTILSQVMKVADFYDYEETDERL